MTPSPRLRVSASPLFPVLVALVVGACSGCLDPVGPPQPPPSPAPTPPRPEPTTPDHTDAEFWNALARRTAAGKIDDTDEIIALVRSAKDAGDVTNALRLEEALPTAAAKNEPITANNRDQIADAIRRLK